jgi:hypothetical protein
MIRLVGLPVFQALPVMQKIPMATILSCRTRIINSLTYPRSNILSIITIGSVIQSKMLCGLPLGTNEPRIHADYFEEEN